MYFAQTWYMFSNCVSFLYMPNICFYESLPTQSFLTNIERDSNVTIDSCNNWEGECTKAEWFQERITKRNPDYTGKVGKVTKQGLAYVMDTFVDTNHPEFESRAEQGAPFENGSGVNQGHGTHVAGIIASRTFGIARGAKIIAVRILSDSGTGSMSNVFKALSWVQQDWLNRNKPHAVINLSFNGPKSDNLNQVVESIRRNGLHVVVAAGNNNQNACDSSPSSANVIVVGATDRNDEKAGFSNWGPCVKLFAPGVDIHSLYPNRLEAIMSGTSMSAPIVAGMILNECPRKPEQMEQLYLTLSTKNKIKNLNNSMNLLAYYIPETSCETLIFKYTN